MTHNPESPGIPGRFSRTPPSRCRSRTKSARRRACDLRVPADLPRADQRDDLGVSMLGVIFYGNAPAKARLIMLLDIEDIDATVVRLDHRERCRRGSATEIGSGGSCERLSLRSGQSSGGSTHWYWSFVLRHSEPHGRHRRCVRALRKFPARKPPPEEKEKSTSA